MSIQLFVVLSIFSSKKPARSYCQDLIKDLKANSPDGVRVHLRSIVIDHAANEYGEQNAPQRER